MYGWKYKIGLMNFAVNSKLSLLLLWFGEETRGLVIGARDVWLYNFHYFKEYTILTLSTERANAKNSWEIEVYTLQYKLCSILEEATNESVQWTEKYYDL